MAGSIQRLADRPSPWRARYRAPDGRERSRTFARKVDAERWLRHELADQDRGRWVDPRAGSVTFGEWADSWLRGLDLKPKTRAVYESALRSRVLPTFGEVELRHISPAAVRTWLAAMLEDGVTARARQARQVLSQALSQAVADGLIARNPCEGVKAPVVRPRRQRFLTVNQLDRLSAACGERQPSAGVLVLFLGWSGLRWGEAAALRVGAVDGKRVRVREAATEVEGRLVFGSPKTHEERTVILPTFVANQVAPLTEDHGPDALVFTAPRGGPLRSSNFGRDVWRPAVAASGSPLRSGGARPERHRGQPRHRLGSLDQGGATDARPRLGSDGPWTSTEVSLRRIWRSSPPGWTTTARHRGGTRRPKWCVCPGQGAKAFCLVNSRSSVRIRHPAPILTR